MNINRLNSINHSEANTHAKIIKENCEHIRVVKEKSLVNGRYETEDIVNSQSTIVPQLQDPLGLMMHITDIVSGITYANSYCLQCNPINLNQSKLIYWSPVLDCNYDVTKDDRNALLDLVHLSKGKVLKYSESLQSWFIDIPINNKTEQNTGSDILSAKPKHSSNITSSNDTRSNANNETAFDSKKTSINDRICRFEPVIPNSVEHMIRFCRANVIDRCHVTQINVSKPENNQTSSENLSTQINQTLADECHSGYQALVYSQTTDIAYRNLACAHCNNEFNVHCEPKMRKILPDDNQARRLSPDLNPLGNGFSTSYQGSFSVLFDLYGSSHDDQQVGVVHQCESNDQIYDPIFLTCRHVVCGLNQRFQDGKCVANQLGLEENRLVNSLSEDAAKTVTKSTGGVDITGKISVGETNLNDNQNVRVDLSIDQLDFTKSPPTSKYTSTTTTDPDEDSEFTDFSITSAQPTTPASDNIHNHISSTIASSILASDSSGFINNQNKEDSPQTFEKDVQVDAANSTSAANRSVPVIKGNTARSIDDSKPSIVGNNNPGTAKMVVPEKSVGSGQRPNAGTKNVTSATVDSIVIAKPSFDECGKIYIDKSQFKLINRTTPEGNSTIAHVELYNLTLEPDQYTLEAGDEESNLLICTPFKTDLVPKFKPIMSIITNMGLVISITSLTLFLLLYVSSSCVSCTGGYRKGSTGSAGHNSLSSRGVVCLATSLLAAYVLFLCGQQLDAINQNYDACVVVAIGTYFSFLMAFNWMFLLSFDVWRTLRLATCHLRGPIIHAQSKRFLIYMIYSLAISSAIVATATYVDFQPQSLSSDHQPNQGYDSNSQQLTGDTTTFVRIKPKQFYLTIIHSIINDYKPKFGQRQGSCWFTNRRGLALFFGLPVTLIMMFNLLFFIHSSAMVIMTSTKSSRGQPYAKGGDLISSIDSASKKTSTSSKRSNMKNNRTVSSFSLTSSSSTTTLDYNTSGERLRGISTGSKDLPTVIIENDESLESVSIDEDKCSIGSKWIRRMIQIFKREQVPSIDSQIYAKQYKGNEESGGMENKSNAYDNNLTIQSTITNLAHDMRDISYEEIDSDNKVNKAQQEMAPKSTLNNNSNAIISTTDTSSTSIDQTKNNEPDKYDGTKKRVSITISDSSTLPLVLEKQDKSKIERSRQTGNTCNRPIQQQLSLMLAAVSKDYRLYWRLSTIMGLTWLTGVVASFVDNDILWYLFVILNTLQGLFIFIAFGCKRSKLSVFEPMLRKFSVYKFLFKKRGSDSYHIENPQTKNAPSQRTGETSAVSRQNTKNSSSNRDNSQ